MATHRTDSVIQTILESLTDAQREAVCHVDGPLLILAGPGSGKTRVVTHRVAYLLSQGVPARQILALTFTNKAADEMRTRLERLAPSQPVWMGTFHRFCSRMLRIHGSLVGLSESFSIYDVDESRALLREAIEEANVSLTHATPDRIAHEISNAKNKLVLPDAYIASAANPVGRIVAEVYPRYQARLLRVNAVDFDDLLLHVAVLLRENPELRRTLDERYRYILVDEYQDTNHAQYAIVRSLAHDVPNLAVTGDPDQSIYGWRGANLNNILEFERDYPNVRVVRLERNYRSTKRILHVADTLISNNRRRKPKSLFTENPEGQPVRLVVYPTSKDESEHIVMRIADDIRQGRRRAGDFAIFYRVNWLSRTFEQVMRSAGVPYQIVKGLEFYQRKEVKDVVAYLTLISNPRDDFAFRRIINTPPRKIGASTVARLAQHANQRQLSLLEAAREAGLIETLTKRAAAHIAAFVAMYDRLCLAAGDSLQGILERVLRETGYVEWLENSGDEDDYERVANLRELVTAASDFGQEHPQESHLEEFLEQVALVSDTDEWESASDRVSLMTLHSAKGLEFPVVYIVGVEHGLIPHERTRDDPDQVEEERRLLFVGITRAEEELQLSYAAYRLIQGNPRMRIASEFLMELPRSEMELVTPRTVASFPDRRDYRDADADSGSQEWIEEEHSTPPAAGKTVATIESASIMTASQLLGETGSPVALSPDDFHAGMLVRHPTHGIGKVVSTTGKGTRKMATVQFFQANRPAKFMLAHSRLERVARPSDAGSRTESGES